MEESYTTTLNQLSKLYPKKGYDKILEYNVGEFFSSSLGTTKKYPVVPLQTRLKVWFRDMLYYRQSNTKINKLNLKNPVILFLGNTIDTRELLPLYEVLEKAQIACFLLSNKHHIYKQLTPKYNILYLPVKPLTENKEINFKQTDGISKGVTTLIKYHYKRNTDWEQKAERVIKTYNPSLVVSTNDLLPEQRIFITVANTNKIPTVNQQHGTINNKPVFSYSNSKNWWVYGQHTKDILVELGLKKENVTVVGTSYLEKYIANSSEANHTNNFVQEEYFKKYKTVFLVLFSGKGHSTTQQNYEFQIEAVKQLAQENKEIGIIVKLHPKESTELYGSNTEENIKLFTHTDFTAKGYDIINFINTSKGIITGVSASIFEAIALQKAVFTLDSLEEYKTYDIINSDITIHNTTTEQFKQQIKEFIETPDKFNTTLQKAREYSLQYFSITEKSSASRKVEAIKRLVA